MIFLIHLFLFLFFLIITALLFLIFILNSSIFGHDLPTSKRATIALAKIIQQYKPNAKILYDLGCAHGNLSLRLKKILPQLNIYGIDNSAIRIFFAKLQAKFLKRNVYFKKQDIFKIDLHNADVIYLYLWYDLMPLLEKKLQKELKQNAMVITNTSHFQNWQPIKKIITYPKISKMPDFETLFVYIKNK